MIKLLCRCKARLNVQAKKCGVCGKSVSKDDKKYFVRIQIQGKRVSRIALSIEMAKELEINIRKKLLSGKTFKKAVKKKEYTLNQIWEKFFKEYRISGKGWRQEENRYNHRIKDTIGKLKLEEITPEVLTDFKTELMTMKSRYNKKYSVKSILHFMQLVNRLIEYSIKLDLFSGINNMKKIRLPKDHVKLVRMLTQEEQERLLKVLETHKNRETAHIIGLLYYQGLRAGEVLKLKWQNISFENKTITLENNKSGLDKHLPLSSQALAILKNQYDNFKRENNDIVFPNIFGEIRKSSFKVWKPIRNAAKVRECFRCHDLRHNAASRMIQAGASLYTVSKLLTHSDVRITERYAHLQQDDLRKALELI